MNTTILKTRVMLGFFILTSFLTAGAADLKTQPLEHSYILRPYVMPPNTFKLGFEGQSYSISPGRFNEEAKEVRAAYPSFSLIRHTQIDDVYLIWNVVPVGFGIQLLDEGTSRLAAEWQINWGSVPGGFYIAPTFSGKRKWSWTPNFGGETILTYGYVYPVNRGYYFWQAGLQLRPLYQTFSWLCMGLEINPLLSNAYLAKIYAIDEDPKLSRTVFQTGVGPWFEATIGKWLAIRSDGKIFFLEYGGQALQVQASAEIYF